MATEEVVLSINQQQLELLDNTVEQGHAVDRVALIRRALREFAGRHPAEAPQSRKD